MAVQCKGEFRWHKCSHSRILSNEAVKGVDLECMGAYFRLRLLAGMTNNNGSLSLGALKQLKEDQVSDYLMSFMPGIASRTARRRAASILSRLCIAGLIKVSRAGVVTIADWKEEQEEGRTAWADYKRRQRNTGGDETASIPPSSPPPQGSGYGRRKAHGSGLDRSNRDIGHVQQEPETETENQRPEKETYVSLKSEPEPETGPIRNIIRESLRNAADGSVFQDSGIQDGGGDDGGMPTDPVEYALRVCDESGGFCRNVWRKKLRELQAAFGMDQGLTLMRDCVRTVDGMWREKRIQTSRAATLNAIIKRRIAGEGP